MPNVTGFKDGREPQTKECQQPLDAGKGEQMDYLLEPPKRNAVLPNLDFSLVRLILDFCLPEL